MITFFLLSEEKKEYVQNSNIETIFRSKDKKQQNGRY
jgi:hypothetical protein